MFILLPCATIEDKVEFPNSGESANLGIPANRIRNILRQYSNVEYLLEKIHEGELIITKKVQFDNYMKMQVDLMRACVATTKPCPFVYSGYMDNEKVVNTSGLSTKEQWAVEMVMSRYTLSSIYHAAALSGIEFMFMETINSYKKDFKKKEQMSQNLQKVYKYFNQAYQPLNRLSSVYDTLQLLFTKGNQQILDSIPQLRKQIFTAIRVLVACNLAYTKLEKYRLLSENRSCKQLSLAVCSTLRDIRLILTKTGLLGSIHPDIVVYLNIGELFFRAYCLYFLLQEHEEMKNKQQYGFVKKQFQQMVVENVVVCEQFEKLAGIIATFPNGQNLDNVVFANMIMQTMLEDVKKIKFAYGINIHENKQIATPDIEQVLASRVAVIKIWGAISQF